LLILSSLESENNYQIIQFYKKDKVVSKFLIYFLKEVSDMEQAVSQLYAGKGKGKERLSNLYGCIPKDLIETVKLRWLTSVSNKFE
jgi:DNA mismatch repair ATPase MutS